MAQRVRRDTFKVGLLDDLRPNLLRSLEETSPLSVGKTKSESSVPWIVISRLTKAFSSGRIDNPVLLSACPSSDYLTQLGRKMERLAGRPPRKAESG